MKQKKLDRVDRRRPLVEINLIAADSPERPASRRRGCAALLSRFGAGVLVAILLGFVLR